MGKQYKKEKKTYQQREWETGDLLCEKKKTVKKKNGEIVNAKFEWKKFKKIDFSSRIKNPDANSILWTLLRGFWKLCSSRRSQKSLQESFCKEKDKNIK